MVRAETAAFRQPPRPPLRIEERGPGGRAGLCLKTFQVSGDEGRTHRGDEARQAPTAAHPCQGSLHPSEAEYLFP